MSVSLAGSMPAMTIDDDRALRNELDEVVRMSLPASLVGLFVLYAIFTVSHALVLPPTAACIMAPLAGTTALVYLLLWLAFRHRPAPIVSAQPLAAGMCALVFVNSFAHILVTGELKHSSNIALALIGTSTLLLSRRWFFGTVVCTLVVWATTVEKLGISAEAVHYVFMLVGAAILSLVTFTTRRRTYCRLATLHVHAVRRQAQLESVLNDLEHKHIALERARAEADAANRAKTEFMALITHELRAPLTSALGYADLLHMSPPESLGELYHEGLGAILRNTRLIADLVSDIADSARLEASPLRLSFTPVSADTVVRDVLMLLRAQIDERRQTVATTYAPDLPPLWADATRMTQIMSNLIGNASKYTPAGGKLAIAIEHVQRDNVVHIAVSDTGIGMSTTDQPMIFQQFFRAQQRGEHTVPGTGLGLHISRRLVEAQGGQIWFESTLGQGSTFHVALPIAPH